MVKTRSDCAFRGSVFDTFASELESILGRRMFVSLKNLNLVALFPGSAEVMNGR